MASELRFPSTANSLSGRKSVGQRKPRNKSEAHLKWVRTLRSLVPGDGPTEAAHVRFADPRWFKPAVGLGEKPDDKWVVPLAADEHRKQHTMDEEAYWQAVGIDPVFVAVMLWNVSGDDEQAEEIICMVQSRTIQRKER